MKRLPTAMLLAVMTTAVFSACSSGPKFKMTHNSDEGARNLAKRHFKFKGSSDALTDFNKTLVPTYQLSLNLFYQTVQDHGLVGRLAGNTSALTMSVGVDPQPLIPVMNEIVAESQARFKTKLQKFGFVVEDEKALRASSGDVKKWYEKKVDPSPKTDEKLVTVASQGIVDGTFATGCNFTRDIDTACQIPRFTISLGSFVKENGPGVITANHEGVDVFFKPEISIDQSAWLLNGKWAGAWIESKDRLVSTAQVSNESEKTADNSEERAHMANAVLNAKRIMGTTDRFLAFSAAGKSFTIKPDPAEFKKAVMAELDRAENLIIETYFQELN